MLRHINFTALALVATALVVSPATGFAQQPGAEQKPPEPAQQGEQKQEGEQKSAEQELAARAMAEYDDAAAKLPHSAGAPECVWTGRRVASLLWRDDIDTARRYIELYDRFKCSSDHLKLVFRCVIKQGPLDAKASDRLAARVHNCWITPEGETTAATEKINSTNAKAATVPN
ncbi:MAG TPA: hypothetical protein VHK26_12595, partial [Methyloceanibacter sp.]|jgi:hypothetical protein|nr:hypothetical protein [Methyloceanibacter sp.]